MLKIKLTDKKLDQVEADLEIILLTSESKKHKWRKDDEILEKMNFKAQGGESLFLPELKRLYIGLDALSSQDIRIATAEAARFISGKKIKTIKVGAYFSDSVFEGVKAQAEGFILGSYTFTKYKSKPAEVFLKNIIISTESYNSKRVNLKEGATALREAEIIAKNVNFVRDLVNQTPDDVTPLTMSKTAREVAKDSKLELKIYGEKYLKDEGMGAFLAVSKASPYPPQLIHLKYRHTKPKLKIALVGKGLTFDTGGLNLKVGDSMLTMKMDKSGGCAIFGIMKAVAELKLPLEVHGIVGAVENAIGQHAYKPDDVLIAKNKKTIEIKNTDAEGRLVLADCLCYAQDQKPDYIIDIATLTGACIVALGEYTIGVMGHSEEMKNSLKKSGQASGELTGDLPFNRYLPKLLKSQVADISNVSSGRWGGAITAGLFLSEFVEEKYKDKWLHLDIAGPAFASSAWGENPAGASGSSVRLLVEWLKNMTLKK